MSGRGRTAPRRWTPDTWCVAQYVALVLVFAAALVLLVLRAQSLVSG